MLSHLLSIACIDSVVVDDRTRSEIENTVRAGILEADSVRLFTDTGANDRVHRDGIAHQGTDLRFGGENHRGHSVVSLQVSTTAANGDVFAYLEEISTDGEVAIRAHGRLRASHRRLGTPAYDYLGLPWHGSFREDYLPMEPGVPAGLRFDQLPTSTIVQRGARLRLLITGADPRQRHFMRTDPPPVVTLHLGGSTPSFIDLPVVP